MDRENLSLHGTGNLPILSREPDALLQAQRLAARAVNHLGTLGVPVTAEVQADGQVSLTLPLPWAHLFLNTLAAQAHAYKEQLHRAAMQERIKRAEQQATMEEARKRLEAQERAIYQEYCRLRKKGFSDRAALEKVRDPDKGSLYHGITDLRQVIREQEALARKGTVEELPGIFAPHRAEVLALYSQGMKPKAIAHRLSLAHQRVEDTLRRARLRGDIPRAKPRKPPVFDEREQHMLALLEQGQRPNAVAEALGVPLQKVYYTLYKAGRRVRPGGQHDGEDHHPRTGSHDL